MRQDFAATLIFRGRLNGTQRYGLGRLLDMLYKPSELAEEVGFSRDQVYRVYLPLGCPHERDEWQHVWINGKAFREWYSEVYKKAVLATNEAFCLRCRRPVPMEMPEKREKGGVAYWQGKCPNCGCTVVRIIEPTRRKA